MNKIIRWIANALIPITILLFSFEDLNSQRLEKFQFSNLNPVRVVVLNLSFSNYSSLLQGQYALGEIIAKVGLVFIPASKVNALKGAQIIISKFFKILPSMNRWGGLPYLSKLLKDVQQKGDDFFNYIKGLLKPRGYDALQNHPALRTDVELLKKLDKYLEGKGDDEINKIKELIDQADSDKSRRLSIDYISKNGFKIISNITSSTIEHLKGEVKGGKAGGGHFYSSIQNGTVRLKPGTTWIPGPHGMVKGKIEIKNPTDGNYIEKLAPETSIFPPSWSDNKTLLEISIAFENRSFVDGNTYKGFSSFGFEIRMYVNSNNEIISAFPIF